MLVRPEQSPQIKKRMKNIIITILAIAAIIVNYLEKRGCIITMKLKKKP